MSPAGELCLKFIVYWMFFIFLDLNTPESVKQLTDSVVKATRKSQSAHDRIHITRGQVGRETTKGVEDQGETNAEVRFVSYRKKRCTYYHQ